MISKKGQFFVLAAVILSAVIVGMTLSVNKADVGEEPRDFYDLSEIVKSESGGVLNYAIYSADVAEGDELENFIGLVAGDVRDKDPEVNLIFIYGDEDNLILQNYGSSDVVSGGDSATGGGKSVISEIRFLSSGVNVVGTFDEFYADDTKLPLENIEGAVVEVSIGSDASYEIPVKPYKQVIVIMQKKEGEEAFIDVR